MSEERFEFYSDDVVIGVLDTVTGRTSNSFEIVDCLNKQQDTISKLEEEKEYWKSKAMTLLMQVRRLTSRMTAKEVMEFSKELEDE